MKSLDFLLRKIGSSRYVRLGVRRRIVNLFRSLDQIERKPFVVEYCGCRYEGDAANAQDWHVFYFGGYELKERDVIAAVLRSIAAPVALDIGANVGAHTIAMSRYASEIHAFEPEPTLAKRLTDRIGTLTHNNVTVHQIGLSDRSGVQTYYFDAEGRNSGVGSFIGSHVGAPASKQLPLARGDDLFASRTVDFVKLDVEGFESRVLKGMRETLNSQQPILMMEITSTAHREIDAQGGLSALLPFDYDCYEICNPIYVLGVFQITGFNLKRVHEPAPRKFSYNVLIVPKRRASSVASALRI
jgi:FkbM family methyltransferase